MRVSEILNKAADLLEKPGAWTQGTFASDDERSLHLYGWEPGATCFCVLGAAQRVCGGWKEWEDSRQEVVSAVRKTTGAEPQIFNDLAGQTQEKVVAALREAAAKAQQSNN